MTKKTFLSFTTKKAAKFWQPFLLVYSFLFVGMKLEKYRLRDRRYGKIHDQNQVKAGK
jgi:uncharacterized membrane protein